VRSVEEALTAILAAARLTEVERVGLDRCLGRVPAEGSVMAPGDVPPFANSSMDGFAVRAADTPGELLLDGEVAAGASSLPTVTAGRTVRIMTGAPMPPGADAVVPIEDATEDGGRVAIPGVVVGRFVRAAGHDTRAGEVVALPPEPMTPSVIAVVASLGVPEVAVRARPRVAVLSTGDELVEPGRQLQPGQIHDANSVALAAAVREAGGEPVPLPRVGDDPEAIEEAIGQAVARADLLVVSGGVSVGRHDHVRDVIERLGSLELWRIAVQPGKPLAFGRIGEVPVVGLPGNPVSALVTFELFVRPLLRAMLGLSGDGRQRVRVRVAERLAKDPERRAYLRVLVSAEDGRYVATSAGGQASSQLRPLAAANALLVVPEGLEATVPGETYDALLFGGLT
jgi:molybdopterin molybdotransferase